MKVLVLAGGVPQAELLRQLKDRGYRTVLADANPGAVAVPFADVFRCTDIFDTDAICRIAREEKVDFVMTVCADQVLLVCAKVSEMLGLPCYIDYETAKNVSDKLLMKKIFRENGIPTTDYIEFEDISSVTESGLEFPLVVKPVDAYSSKGVRKACDSDELEIFAKEAKKISRSGKVIAEEYFEGTEVSIDAFVCEGKAKVLCISESDKVKYNDRFVIFRGRYPSSAGEKVRNLIEETAQKIADAFGLYNSPLLVQVLVNGDRISVLEFCARTGGNMKYLLIKNSCGVDVISAAIDITVKKRPCLDIKDTGNAYVVNDFIYCNPGIFDRITGAESLVTEGYINEFHTVRAPGTVIKGAFSSSDRVAGINITASSKEEINSKQRIINGRIKALDTEGKDIMRHDILTDI